MSRTAVEVLHSVPLLAGLDAGVLEELGERAIPRTLHRGQLLFRKGEACAGLHVVVSGRVKVYCASPQGRQQVLHRIGPGNVVTELPLFDDGPYAASARVVTECRLLFVPREAVARLRVQHPELAEAVVRDLGRSIRRLTSLVETVVLKGVRARVARALLERAGGEALEGDGTFRLEETQEELAQALALTRESVARALADLRRERVVQQHGAEVRILDVDALIAAADDRPPGASRVRIRRLGDRALGAFGALREGPCC